MFDIDPLFENCVICVFGGPQESRELGQVRLF